MIELNYNLSEEDFLNLQLFQASTNEHLKKQRVKEKYRMLGIFALFTIVLFIDDSFSFYAYFFLASFVLFFVIYPWWAPWFYKRMYKRQIAQQFKEIFPYFTRVTLDEKTIDIVSPKGNSHFPITDIKSIAETGDYFYLSIGNFIVLIIPKKQLNDLNTVKDKLLRYNTTAGIPYSSQLNWKWK